MVLLKTTRLTVRRIEANDWKSIKIYGRTLIEAPFQCTIDRTIPPMKMFERE